MQREAFIQRLSDNSGFDLAVIGGGATGLGVALEASLRGFKVILLESHDFAKGTSSRATKLVHGGVRYLAQGNIGLVREALSERTTLLKNAPHLTDALPFVMPSYQWWEMPFYGLGLKAYDTLAGRASLGPTELLGKRETLQLLPTARSDGLYGGVKYWDGQFDDARLALALARSAAKLGALVLNYCPVVDLISDSDKLVGIECLDSETGRRYKVGAKCVVNATGVWVDGIRQMEVLAKNGASSRMVSPSQGVHLVVDRKFLATDHALMIPKTADGRVLFAVPWLGKTLLGTTDTPRADLVQEPRPFQSEVDLILNESARYLKSAPSWADVKSAWVGLRPLVKHQGEDASNTKSISREHTVVVGKQGLVTVTGGKWTTYRAMAEDVMEQCFESKLLPTRAGGQSKDYALHGAKARTSGDPRICDAPGLHSYGSDAAEVTKLVGADKMLCDGLSESMVRFGVREEYARTVEDILARRSRTLFLDAKVAYALAPKVAELMRSEGLNDTKQAEFEALAQRYQAIEYAN